MATSCEAMTLAGGMDAQPRPFSRAFDLRVGQLSKLEAIASEILASACPSALFPRASCSKLHCQAEHQRILYTLNSVQHNTFPQRIQNKGLSWQLFAVAASAFSVAA